MKKLVDKYAQVAPELSQLLETNFQQAITVFAFPQYHRPIRQSIVRPIFGTQHSNYARNAEDYTAGRCWISVTTLSYRGNFVCNTSYQENAKPAERLVDDLRSAPLSVVILYDPCKNSIAPSDTSVEPPNPNSTETAPLVSL